VHEKGGLVLELGCGSGLLTRYLVDAGHHVVATDASPSMLDLARQHAAGAAEIRQLVLPDGPLPDADAIVSIGHVLSYLSSEADIEQALVSAADALRPGGVLAIDLCDLEWAEFRRDAPTVARRGDDWVIVTEYSIPSPDRFVREMTTFLPNPDGTWRRDDERHVNVMFDTSRIPALLTAHGVEATIGKTFGTEELPAGLVTVIGRRRS